MVAKMRKWVLFFWLIGMLFPLLSQKVIMGRVYDAATSYPIKGANVYNLTTNQHVFTDEDGIFRIRVSLHDSVVVSSPRHRQLLDIVAATTYDRGRKDYFLNSKSFMLPGVKVIGLNPSYEGFKRDIANSPLPDSYKNLDNVHLTKEDRRNATYTDEAPNVLKGTAIGSPITLLYNIFNKRMKTKRLYYEMEGYGEEVQQVPMKYNRELVAQITGLQEPDLMEFMVFCRFSYYDLVRWSREEIVAAIRYKFDEYQYFKALEEEE